PGAGAEGFGGDDARTSIFDYWSMPEFVKWVNDHKYDGAHLSVAQREIREFYGRLVNLIGQPAFADGKFLALNPANHDNERFGRLPGEEASGHWLYAFLRYDIAAEQRFLVVANLHPAIAFDDVRILLPPAALQFLQLQHVPLTLIERLSGATERVNVSSNQAVNAGIPIAQISRLSALYFEFA
ncbi:MAG TPA: hypothetical protein VLO30_07790, partial [Chthoniobacterales bacterium]|nr:hypothetical protein [Chthoniobacterales bacterium]